MKFGCALPFSVFLNKESSLTQAFGGKEGLLSFCAKEFDTVELRTVSASADPQAVCDAVRLCRNYGLTVTIHGQPAETAEAFFAPYLLLLASDLQPVYNITVHPRADLARTEEELAAVCRLAEEKGYPVFITLENQRMKNGVAGGVCADVAAIVRKIASPLLGVCFDFGHSLSNERNFNTDAPTEDFYPLVRHTHIHSLCDGRTHFPITCGETLLNRNLGALAAVGYDGVLSLELSPERFQEKYDIRAAYVGSAAMLKRAARAAEERQKGLAVYRDGYAALVREARRRLDACEAAVATVGHAAYLVKLGNTRIAVDVSLAALPVSAEGRAALIEALSDFDAVIVTHSHGDHWDKGLLAALPPRVRRLIPDFMREKAEADAVLVQDGGSYTVGDVAVTFFASEHRSVPQYGFALAYEGEHYVFPTDVRDFEAPHPVFPRTRALFAHLWLGRATALNPQEKMAQAFCEFVRSYGAEQIYLGHLCDVRRELPFMWTGEQVACVAPYLSSVQPLYLGDLAVLKHTPHGA